MTQVLLFALQNPLLVESFPQPHLLISSSTSEELKVGVFRKVSSKCFHVLGLQETYLALPRVFWFCTCKAQAHPGLSWSRDRDNEDKGFFPNKRVLPFCNVKSVSALVAQECVSLGTGEEKTV